VILVDPMLASGGSAIRAIQVLKVKLTELMRGTKLYKDRNRCLIVYESIINVTHKNLITPMITITGKTQNKETVPTM
jgi:hypothetical protein